MIDLVERVRGVDHFLLVARLSLIITVVNANESPIVFVASAATTAAIFLQPRLLRIPWPWLALALLLGTSQLLRWWTIDDHLVVTTYWLLAIGLSRITNAPRRFLATSARLLLGLVFAFAFTWKALSSQFASTDFFRYTLMVDDRFALVSEHVGGTDDRDRRSAELAIESLRAAPNGGMVEIAEGPRNDAVARVFTWWGIVIEGTIALAFLAPLRRRWRWLRPATLFAFSFTTYAVVPVAGFGALLMLLGLAQRDSPKLRVAYVASFGALLVWGAAFPLLL